MGLGPGACTTMAGAYVPEILQWRGNGLDYMNSRFGARRTFEKLGVEAENDRSIAAPLIPRNSEGRWMPYIVHLHEAILSIHKRIPGILCSASFSPVNGDRISNAAGTSPL